MAIYFLLSINEINLSFLTLLNLSKGLLLLEGNSHSDEEKVDFLLQGLGVQPQHALIEVLEEPPRLFVSLLVENARVCVNGRLVPFGEKCALKNGYRLLIG